MPLSEPTRLATVTIEFMKLEDFDDELESIELSWTPFERIDILRARVQDFQPGEIGRATFLTSLAGQLNVIEDFAGAREAGLAAIEDGGPTDLDPRCGLLMNELHAGEDARADELLAELLTRFRAGLLGDVECEWIAGSLEEAGRLRPALRWFTMPMADIHPDDTEDIHVRALNGRYRVRRQLGLPVDAYDLACEDWDSLDDELDEDSEL